MDKERILASDDIINIELTGFQFSMIERMMKFYEEKSDNPYKFDIKEIDNIRLKIFNSLWKENPKK